MSHRPRSATIISWARRFPQLYDRQKWFGLAAEANEPDGFVGLSLLRGIGILVKRDPAKAAGLLETAVALGSNGARLQLVNMLLSGEDDPNNIVKAVNSKKRPPRLPLAP